MRVKFLDLQANYRTIKDEVDTAIHGVLDKNNYILGEELEVFEKNFAKYCEVNHCIGVANGTDALEIAMRALDLDETAEVIVPGNTFVATCLGVINNNYKLVLCDTDPSTHQVSMEDLKRKVTPRTKVIVAVHLYGLVTNMDEMCAYCRDNDIILIEDAAQAHGAQWNGNKVGSFGKISCFSFYPGKNLGAYGDGGAICTSDSELERKMRLIRNTGSVVKYRHEILGRNSRLDTIQAAVLDTKLKYLDDNNRRRRNNASIYAKYLPKNVKLPQVIEGSSPVYHLYVIRTTQRDELSDYLKENGIDTLIHYPIPCSELGALNGVCADGPPNCIALSKEILSLPMYPELPEAHIKYVCETINRFFSEKKKLISLQGIRTEGKGGVLNCLNSLKFDTRRVFYIDAFHKNQEPRGNHANRTCNEFLFVTNGSMKVKLTDTDGQFELYYLSKNDGIMIPSMKWIQFWSLTDDSTVMVLCDEEFISDNSKSITDFHAFSNIIK